MAYELLLQQPPFEAESPVEVMMMHLRDAPTPPQELWPSIPAALDALLIAMLAKDPRVRPSACEVAIALAAVRDELEALRGSAVSLRVRGSARVLVVAGEV